MRPQHARRLSLFALNGLCFATLASRYPDLRGSLGLSNGSLGLLLLAIAVGSVLGMPTQRTPDRAVRRRRRGPMGACTVVGSMVVAGIGAATGVVPLVALGLFGYGIGTGTWTSR